MTASSNFGNVFSVLVAAPFLPFLPMLPLHLRDSKPTVRCIPGSVPFDNVDEEQNSKRRSAGIRRIWGALWSFGPISSIFDILTFCLMWWVFHAIRQTQTLFQSGWFVVGLLSQT